MSYGYSSAASYASELRQYLADRVPPIAVQVHECIDSTNLEAKRLAVGGSEDTLIVAERQTAGRGRLGRSFHSPVGTGAYFSLLYTPSASINAAVTVTCASSVAVMRAIRRLVGKEAGIKWVNDLYLDGKKICGILCESVCVDGKVRIVIGIGINIATSFEGTELASIAGSIGCSELSPAALIAEVLCELYPLLEDPEGREWIDDYRATSTVLSRRVSFAQEGVVREGIALSIDGDGALIVRTDDGIEHRLFSGEITVRTQ